MSLSTLRDAEGRDQKLGNWKRRNPREEKGLREFNMFKCIKEGNCFMARKESWLGRVGSAGRMKDTARVCCSLLLNGPMTGNMHCS